MGSRTHMDNLPNPKSDKLSQIDARKNTVYQGVFPADET